MLFAGCYFAATGEVEALRGFLKGVLADRLLERQDDLQWTEAALKQDASYENWARAGMLASALLIIGNNCALLLFAAMTKIRRPRSASACPPARIPGDVNATPILRRKRSPTSRRRRAT